MPDRSSGPGGGQPPRSPLGINWGRVLTLLGLGLLVALALLRLAGGREALRAILAVSPGALGAMLAVFYLSILLRIWRWQVLLEAVGHRVGLWPLGRLLFTGYFLNTVVPARAGDVARILLLGRWHRVPLETATGSMVVERALDVIVILTGAATAAFVVLPELVPPAVVQVYVAALLLMVAAGVALLAAPRLEGRLLGLWSNARYQAALRAGFSFLRAMRGMAADKGRLALALAQTAGVWAGEVTVAGLVMGALGIHLPVGRLIFMILTVDLVGAIPLLPGGLGQVEAVYLSLLLLLGASRSSAGVTILLHRAITFWSIMLVGGAITLLGGTLRSAGAAAREGEVHE